MKFLLRKSEVGDASEVWLTPSEVKFAKNTSPQAKLHYEVTSLPEETSLAAGKLSYCLHKQTIDSTWEHLGNKSAARAFFTV